MTNTFSGLRSRWIDAERVRGLERLEDLRRVLARGRDRQPPLALEHARQRLALEELHHDVRVALRRAVDVGDLHHVRAADLRGDARLLEEALDEAGAPRELRVEHLDGDARAEHRVRRLVDRAHPAVAEQADEAVLAVDDGSDVDHGRGPGGQRSTRRRASVTFATPRRAPLTGATEARALLATARARSPRGHAACFSSSRSPRMRPTVSASSIAANTGRSPSTPCSSSPNAPLGASARACGPSSTRNTSWSFRDGASMTYAIRDRSSESSSFAAANEDARVGDEVARLARQPRRTDEGRVGHAGRHREEEQRRQRRSEKEKRARRRVQRLHQLDELRHRTQHLVHQTPDERGRRERRGPALRRPRRRPRRARPEDALAGVEALRQRAFAAPERRAGLDAADDRPEAVGRVDVVKRERQRSAKGAGRHRAHEDEVAHRRLARAPANEGVADLTRLDRPPQSPAPPDDVLLGDNVLDLRAPPDREAPRRQRDGGRPGREEHHAADGHVERLGDDERVANRDGGNDRRGSGNDLLREGNGHRLAAPLPDDALAEERVTGHR